MTSVKAIARKAFKAGAITEDDYHQVLALDRAYMEMLAEKGTIINNIPTVETDILYLCDHKKCGENYNCFECNHTSDIRHAINFDLMEFPRSVFVERTRPQGEWIVEKDVYCRCPFCNFKDVKYSNYCPDCGASMRPKPNQLRDCENCVHHSDNGCEVWKCEFEKRSDV